MEIRNGKVLITGATGFIGGRIAERLWIDRKVTSKALVRNFSKAARLARLPVRIVQGDLLDKDSLRRAVEGCEVVFHCAYGNTDDPSLNRRINEDGTRNIGEAALEAGVRRFIHLSTVAVYGPNPPAFVDEKTPTEFSGDEYGDSKLRAEQVCFQLFREGLPVVIVRPTIVFGPFSPIWTIGIIERLKLGGWENVQGIDGLCNAVYIDDLVDALFLCVEVDKAVGEVFIISGPKPISWREYFDTYRKLLNLPNFREVSRGRWKIEAAVRSIVRSYVKVIGTFFEPQLQSFYRLIRMKRPSLAGKLERLVRGGVRSGELRLFQCRSTFMIDKAKRMLGYRPSPFEEGMKVTEEWLRYHEYIDV